MFHEAVLHRDPASENRFMLYETWESHGDVIGVQLLRPYRQAWHEALPTLLEQERDITIWEPLRADRKGNIDKKRIPDKKRRQRFFDALKLPSHFISAGTRFCCRVGLTGSCL
jgi:hypothetical protein